MACNSVALQHTKNFREFKKAWIAKDLQYIHLGYQRVMKYDELFHMQPRVWKVATNLKLNPSL